MKFTARIASLIITLLLILIITLFHFLHRDDYYFDTIIGMILCLPVIWWIAKQYNKLNLYQQQVREKEEVLEGIFNNVDAYVYSVDLKTGKTRLSLGAERLYGYRQEDFEKNPSLWKEVIHPDDIKQVEKNEQKLYIEKSVQDLRHVHRIIRSDGTVLWVDGHMSTVMNVNKEVTKLNVFLYDITEHKKAEKKVRHMAYHDTLTSLPNRLLCKQYLDQAIVYCQEHQTNLSVLFIDINRFKLINDTFGHATGDILLKAIAKRLNDSIRQQDIVSRHSGDEFILLLKDAEKKEIIRTAERIIEQFSAPFYINGKAAFISPSIGISQYPADGEDQETLIRKADQAMYDVKQNRKNSYQFYDALEKSKVSSFEDNLSIESELRRALKNDELELYYQPLVNIASQEIYGAEALIRWNHPECGLISPARFLSIAEETGLILEMGEWVLQTACYQNKQWQEKGFSPIKMSVNVSGLQFQSADLIEIVEAILQETGLESRYLGIEVIEDVIQNLEGSMTKFNQLKAIGTNISIDDFGTGYSSLSRLKYLPVDCLKIDKSFTSSIGTNEEKLVKTMIDMGRNLNIDVIVEGIETKEQADFLKENGCLYGQGFYYSKPLPAEAFEQQLQKQQEKELFTR